MIRIEETSDGLFVAHVDGIRSLKYGTREGALVCLCERLARDLARERDESKSFEPVGGCMTCNGWGAPSGCLACGMRSMGG